MKIFISNSVLSIVFKLCLFIPFLLFIPAIINENLILLSIVCVLLSETSLIFLFGRFFGLLMFKNDQIFVSSDWKLFKPFKIQYMFKALIKDIASIDYVEELCSSNGQKINMGKYGTPVYLKLNMKNGTVERIFLSKFSFKTWKKIERNLLSINKEILVLRDASSFKKYLKTGIINK